MDIFLSRENLTEAATPMRREIEIKNNKNMLGPSNHKPSPPVNIPRKHMIESTTPMAKFFSESENDISFTIRHPNRRRHLRPPSRSSWNS